jgi:hypothetical protein
VLSVRSDGTALEDADTNDCCAALRARRLGSCAYSLGKLAIWAGDKNLDVREAAAEGNPALPAVEGAAVC